MRIGNPYKIAGCFNDRGQTPALGQGRFQGRGALGDSLFQVFVQGAQGCFRFFLFSYVLRQNYYFAYDPGVIFNGIDVTLHPAVTSQTTSVLRVVKGRRNKDSFSGGDPVYLIQETRGDHGLIL